MVAHRWRSLRSATGYPVLEAKPECIGIDDASPGALAGPVTSTEAEEFDRVFQSVYLTFHRRDRKRSELTAASRAVLTHLGLSGPVTIGEAAAHLNRAQSVVSDIVSQLEDKGLLEREADPADRRRTLVWLTPTGFDRLAADRRVLSTELLNPALAGLTDNERAGLFRGLRALLATPATQHRLAHQEDDPAPHPDREDER